jgi:hypothetical protein
MSLRRREQEHPRALGSGPRVYLMEWISPSDREIHAGLDEYGTPVNRQVPVIGADPCGS